MSDDQTKKEPIPVFSEGDEVWAICRIESDTAPLLDIRTGKVTMTDVSEGVPIVFVNTGSFRAEPMIAMFCRKSEVEALDLMLYISQHNTGIKAKALTMMVESSGVGEETDRAQREFEAWDQQRRIAALLRANYDFERGIKPVGGDHGGLSRKERRAVELQARRLARKSGGAKAGN